MSKFFLLKSAELRYRRYFFKNVTNKVPSVLLKYGVLTSGDIPLKYSELNINVAEIQLLNQLVGQKLMKLAGLKKIVALKCQN